MPPIKEARDAATAISTVMRTLMFIFMVMLTLYNSVLTDSAWLRPGRWAAEAVRINWGEGLGTAATLIPARLLTSLSPVERQTRREQ